MRPIERGAVPVAGGIPKVFAQYADARGDLFVRLGRYCSFCERPIKAGLAVEHVFHKDAYPHLECEWSNFLLACVNCNSTKGTKVFTRKQLFLPDQDNTFRALRYSPGGNVSPYPMLSSGQKGKATRLIRLVGLNKAPVNDPQVKDQRWNDRREAWDKATRYLTLYQLGRAAIEDIVELCQAVGHWSIWMTVFAGVRDVLLALIADVSGTADCFDEHGLPVVRGQV
jgi:uncharacterized protein (TIGR02646 family)